MGGCTKYISDITIDTEQLTYVDCQANLHLKSQRGATTHITERRTREKSRVLHRLYMER